MNVFLFFKDKNHIAGIFMGFLCSRWDGMEWRGG